MACKQSISVQDAGDEIVTGKQYKVSYGSDHIG
jgi:hypothetical protein